MEYVFIMVPVRYLRLPRYFYSRLQIQKNENIVITASNTPTPYHLLGRKTLLNSDIILGKTHVSIYNIVKEDLINIEESNDFYTIYIPKDIKINKLPVKILGNIDTDKELVLEVQVQTLGGR